MCLEHVNIRASLSHI